MRKQESQRVVVYDVVRPRHVLSVWLRALTGQKIVMRPFPSIQREQRWQAWLEQRGFLHRLQLATWPHRSYNPCMDRALELTERLYEEQWSAHPITKAMVRLYDDPRVEIVFKKALCEDLRRHEEYRLWCEAIDRALGNAFWLYAPVQPEDAVPVWSGKPEDSCKQELALGARVRALVVRAKARLVWPLAPLALVAKAAVKRLAGNHAGLREQAGYGMAIVSPHREFASTLRGPGFLLDEKNLRKDNTVFVSLVPLAREELMILARQGLRVMDPAARLSGREWVEILRVAVLICRMGSSAPLWMTRAATYLMHELLRWKGVASAAGMRAFVSYADYGLRHVARNILLGKEGVQTWYYSDAEGVFDTMPGPQYRDKLFGYMFFDHVVTWSGRFARYLQRHNQVVGHYHVVGGIWSEHVRMIREGRLNTNLPERLRAHGWRSGLKLIGAFDSGLMDDTLITQADGVAFARDLFRLLADLPDVCLLWKEKKTPEQQRDMGNEALVALYEEMKRHPRCYFTGVATSPSEVMAVSDLCIGFCYGSPVTEALGAGVKAIYHDPDKKYAGGYYDRVPGLVTHDYDALRRRVSDLLYRTTDAEYRMFLDTQVKGDIDPCLDGLGLTRFRELLMVGEP